MTRSAVDPQATYAIQPATTGDVPGIRELVAHYAALGSLLPRPEDELYHQLTEFHVIRVGSRVIACGALEIFTEELAEIRSLVVDDDHLGSGLGRQLVSHLLDQARARGLKRVMALTYVPEFFHKLGFVSVSKNTLPEKVWGICVKCYRFHRCDETAVLLHL